MPPSEDRPKNAGISSAHRSCVGRDILVDDLAELLHALCRKRPVSMASWRTLLGEHLVERALDEDPRLLQASFGHAG